jgi:hypothetical protein
MDGTMGAPVNEVDILIDGSVVCHASLGDYRPDVQANNGYAPGFDLTYSGWDFSYNIGGLSPGNHTLTAVAYDDNWNASQLNNTWTLTVSADPAPTPSISVDQCYNGGFISRPYHGSRTVTVRYSANDPAGFLSGIRYNVWNPTTGYFDNGGGGFASESGTSGEVDRTVTLDSDGTWYFWTDAEDCFGNNATTGAWWSGYNVTVFENAPPPPPTIAWTSNPSSVVTGQPYTISAQANDNSNSSASVRITKNSQPFASSSGGNGATTTASGSSADAAGSVTYTATATDSFGFVSGTITWTVTVAKATPVITNWPNRAIANNTGYTILQTDLNAVVSNPYAVGSPPAAPVFNPPAGTYTDPLSVSITASTNGGAIYYTTDGSTPTMASTQYSSPVSLPMNATTTINAIAVNSNGLSPVTSGTYTVNPPPPPAAPVFNPSAGTYVAPLSITITAASGATIHYTTNGTTPTASSAVYSGPFSLSVGTTLVQAIAVNRGGSSPVTSGSYTVNLPPPPAAPVFNPSAGTYASPPSITIAAASGATIHYTTNGTTPTASSAVYSGPFSLSVGTTLVQAIAVNIGGSSPVTSGSYTVNPPPPAAPVLSPSAGTYAYASSPSITITAPSGGTIHYTTDGSTPTASSAVYSGPFSLSVGTTLVQAIAVNIGGSSPVTSGSYTVNPPPPPPDAPVFDTASGTYTDPLSVGIADSSGGVTIYYTTDGSTPTTSSTQYSGPVSLPTDTTTTINAIAVNGNGLSTVTSGTYTVNSPPPPPPPPPPSE